MPYDVVTLGETMIRLTPPGLKRIEQAEDFEIHIGGTESNTAVGLVRLGMNVCWISRLTDNPLGRLIAGMIARYGVDTSHVIWTDEDRVGVYFLEEGKAPRGSRVIYDRANSAMSKMQPQDLPLELFQPGSASLLHLTGITLAIGAGDTARRAFDLAKEAGWLVSFDVNHRAMLWTSEEAREQCEPFMQAADIIFVPFNDARTIYDVPDTPEEALELLAGRYPQARVVMTLGADGAIACDPAGPVQRQPVFPADPVGRMGGGDAFAAGFLHGYLTAESREERLAHALRWGAAVAALKYSISGDMPLIERAEAEALVRGSGSTTQLTR